MKVKNGLYSVVYFFLPLAVLLASIAAGPASADNPRPHYTLDIADAEVTFSVKVLGLVTVKGQFRQVEGDIQFTEACDTSNIAFRIQAASVSTRDRMMDKMIRGTALLNSDQYPVITFNSSQVTGGASGPETITGNLTLNGIQRSVSFAIKSENAQPAYTGEPLTYRADTHIKRSDFGIPSPVPGTSNRINIEVSLIIRQSELMLATNRF